MPAELPSLFFSLARNPAVAVGIPLALGTASGLITKQSVNSWYPTLRKPAGNPPKLAFPIVWTLLYAGMGFSSYLLVKAHDKELPGTVLKGSVGTALGLYWGQLALNLAWTPLFFGGKDQGVVPALVDIGILTPLVFTLTYLANQIDTRTTYLLAPYCAWLSYATYLNASIWWLNKDTLPPKAGPKTL